MGEPGAVRDAMTILVLLALLFSPRCAHAQTPPSSSNGSNNNNSNNNNGYPNYGLSNFNPSMAIVIVVLISAFFFLGFFSIYIRQCAGDGRGAGGSTAPRGALGRGRSRRQRGLDPTVLETFPTMVYSEVKGLKIGKGALECAVCLSEFDDDETLRLLPRCDHAFHPDCIDAWLSSHVTCPVCRADLSLPVESPELVPAPEDATPGPDPQEAGDPATRPPDSVAITVDDDGECERRPPLPQLEQAELARLTSQRQALRAKSTARPPRFPRSHSTGHSVAQMGENIDRYTLRLPEHIRKEIVETRRLQRAKSFPANAAAAAAGEGSLRRVWRWAGGEGSSRGGRSVRLGRSDRWPSFLMRTLSVKMPAWRRGDGEGSVKKGASGEGEGSVRKGTSGEGEGSTKGKVAAVRTPFDCLGGGTSDTPANESATAPLARV